MYRYALLIVLCTVAAASQTHAASTVEQERSRLAALEQSLSRQQAEVGELRNELESYPARLSEAEDALLRAEQELANHQRDLAEMQRRAQQEDSLQLNRDINLKEHAISMAERRVRSETRMLERYRRYYNNLRDDIANGERDIAQLTRRLADQQQRLDFAQAAPSESRPPAVAAPSVIKAPASAPSVAPASSANLESTADAAVAPPVLSAADMAGFKLADSTMSRVEELVAANPNSSPRFTNLQLVGADLEPVAFSHLGANQYQAEVVLPSGSHRFRIDSLRFRVQIPAEDAGELFVFVVDASDRQRTKAFYFKKALLAYRNQAPVLAQQSSKPKPEPAVEQVQLASGKTVALSEDDAFALEIARDQMNLLADLELDLNKRDHNSRYSISGNLMDNASMAHLGGDQYLAEVTVQSGRQTVRINRSTFRIEIPDADEGEVYLFFVDASQPNRLQMTYYKKALLQYL